MAEAGDHLRAGDPVRAAAACREAVRLEPSLGAGWLALGEASAAAGDRETARTAFERCLALEPEGRRAAEARAALERLRP
jgi:predicted TPR repeat methyltransferase